MILAIILRPDTIFLFDAANVNEFGVFAMVFEK